MLSFSGSLDAYFDHLLDLYLEDEEDRIKRQEQKEYEDWLADQDDFI